MSYLKYSSPYKKDYDIKDKTISQLKSDIIELQQNEKDFNELSSQLKNLEYRYNLLQEEKERIDLEYKNRNEVNLKLIASLRTDVDTLKSTISEKNLEIQAIRSELLATKGISDQRFLDISKLKKELEIMAEDENRIEFERTRLEENVQNFKLEKRQLLSELDNMNETITEEINKNNELEKIIEDLMENKKQNEFQNEELRNSLENAEKSLMDANRIISMMENESKSANKEIENSQDEIAYLKKSLEKEMNSSKELNSKISNLEGNIRSKENQNNALKKDVELLNGNYSEALENNMILSKNEDASKKIIDTLTFNNNELINMLNELNDQDDQIRELMEKKNKISDMKKRNDANLRTIFSNGN